MSIYTDFIQKKKDSLPYLKLEFGDKFEGKFKGATPKKNRWGSDTLSYAFLDNEGRRKEWDNGSPSIAEAFAKIPEGTLTTITCSASDRTNQEGQPYKDYKIFVDGKEITESDEVNVDN